MRLIKKKQHEYPSPEEVAHSFFKEQSFELARQIKEVADDLDQKADRLCEEIKHAR